LAARPATTQADAIGLSELQAAEPSLTGAGVAVAQPEANYSSSASDVFEVSPFYSGVDQPASLFTYISDLGMASGFPNAVGTESAHADLVAANFYGATSGVAPGVSSVDSYLADTFVNNYIATLTPIRAQVVNQSFIDNDTPANLQALNDAYDNYVAKFGTIIVSAVGNGGSVNSPATAYNVIGVGDDDGASSVGPTSDGRSKPDITAPGGETSFSTPYVSGAAALLVQAGQQGYGGASAPTEAAAIDPRTIKALLLNGAVKPAGWTHTPTTPLDPHYGAGVLNIYDSFLQLQAGEHSASSTSATPTVGGAHPAVAGGNITSLSGWNLSSLTSSSSADAYDNYVFALPAGPPTYSLTSTLVWERPEDAADSNPINNFYLYLYNMTTSVLAPIDLSDSTVDNVQQLDDLNLTPGDTYDIEVFKTGGAQGDPGVITYADTYALAFDFAPVPEPGPAAALLFTAITLIVARAFRPCRLHGE
jgi:hypothetical protein